MYLPLDKLLERGAATAAVPAVTQEIQVPGSATERRDRQDYRAREAR
jgi:hypothetical protein